MRPSSSQWTSEAALPDFSGSAGAAVSGSISSSSRRKEESAACSTKRTRIPSASVQKSVAASTVPMT